MKNSVVAAIWLAATVALTGFLIWKKPDLEVLPTGIFAAFVAAFVVGLLVPGKKKRASA